MKPPEWREVQAADGQSKYIDVASVSYRTDLVPPFDDQHVGRIARALVYTDDQMPIGTSNAGWFDFDCEKPYLVGQAGVWPAAPAEFLPPRSIGDQIRRIACGLPSVDQGESAKSAAEMDPGDAIREMNGILKDPEKVKRIECLGIKVYRDPQPPGHPPSQSECMLFLKQSNADTQAPAPKAGEDCQREAKEAMAQWGATKEQAKLVEKGERCLLLLQVDSKMFAGKRTAWLIEAKTAELLAEFYAPTNGGAWKDSDRGLCSFRGGKFPTSECTWADWGEKADQM